MKIKLNSICIVDNLTHHDMCRGIVPGVVCEIIEDFGEIFRVHFFENEIGDCDNIRSLWKNQLETIADNKDIYLKRKE